MFSYVWAALAAVAILVSHPASAQNTPWSLVCFERSGIEESLDKVINAQQFLRNDRILQSGSCGFAQIPKGSTARFSGFHETQSGFIYPIFRMRYATTGQRMYAADGIYKTGSWRLSRRCGAGGAPDGCLVPRSCEALDGLLQRGGRFPSYMRVPAACQEQFTN